MSTITIKGVKETLGADTNSIMKLCKHENVNMFSRHKPIIYPGFPKNENYFESINGNFGIVIPERSTSVAEYGWLYERPAGSANSPYRLDDFRGYNHDAAPVLKRLEKNYTIEIIRDTILHVNFSTAGEISVNEILINYEAAPDEPLVSSLGELYIAMDIVKEGTIITTVKASKTIGSGGLNLNYDCSSLKSGTYNLSFYLTTSHSSYVHDFDMYTDFNMPNPAFLEVITPSESDNFVFDVIGIADGGKNSQKLDKRLTVYFDTKYTATLNSGLYIVTKITNKDNSTLEIKWNNFSVNMVPNFYYNGIKSIALYNDPMSWDISSNINEGIINIDGGIQIPSGLTARIGIFFNRIIEEGQAIINGEYTITTTIAYNKSDLWNGTLLINAITL